MTRWPKFNEVGHAGHIGAQFQNGSISPCGRWVTGKGDGPINARHAIRKQFLTPHYRCPAFPLFSALHLDPPRSSIHPMDYINAHFVTLGDLAGVDEQLAALAAEQKALNAQLGAACGSRSLQTRPKQHSASVRWPTTRTRRRRS